MKESVVIRSGRTKWAVCPACLTIMDAATGVGPTGKAPSPGSISICGYCKAVNVFDEQLQLRPATQQELDILPPETKRMLAMLVKDLPLLPKRIGFMINLEGS